MADDKKNIPEAAPPAEAPAPTVENAALPEQPAPEPELTDAEKVMLEHEGQAALFEMGEAVPDPADAVTHAEAEEPAEVVCSRFMKLNADHIRFVLKCLAENSSPIRNMKQYLLASLYNAPTTMQLSYQNQTNHDLAIRR